MAVEGLTRNGKAIGTRDRVVAWLAANGDVQDSSGMASTALARAIGYPGSSIAFAQLLSGMERSGLITREVRGKRTYRVRLTDGGRQRASTPPRTEPAGSQAPGRRGPGHPGRRHQPVADRERGTAASPHGVAGRRPEAEGTVDYDELARRLLLQVARRLTTEPERFKAAEDAVTSASRDSDETSEVGALQDRLSSLERELSRARAARVALQEENEELRDQLERIRSSLDGDAGQRLGGRVAAGPADEIDHSQIALLKRMLADRQGGAQRKPGRATTA